MVDQKTFSFKIFWYILPNYSTHVMSLLLPSRMRKSHLPELLTTLAIIFQILKYKIHRFLLSLINCEDKQLPFFFSNLYCFVGSCPNHVSVIYVFIAHTFMIFYKDSLFNRNTHFWETGENFWKIHQVVFYCSKVF